MSTTLYTRPTISDLHTVARGPIQHEILQALVSGEADPDTWNEPERDRYPHCRGWRAYHAMEPRLLAALCPRAWTVTWSGNLILTPITPYDLRVHLRVRPEIRPSDGVLRHVLEPLAGTPLDDETLQVTRALMEQTWMTPSDILTVPFGVTVATPDSIGPPAAPFTARAPADRPTRPPSPPSTAHVRRLGTG